MRRADYFGEEIDLLKFIKANRNKLVLKPNDDYGGHGITIGWNADEIGWEEALARSSDERRLSGAGTGAHSPRNVSRA